MRSTAFGMFVFIATCTAASAAPSPVHLKTLSTFDNTNGTYPETAPLVGVGGVLYGTTSFGGSNDLGVVYKVSTSGHVDVLHSFDGADGAHPYADLVVGPGGKMIGATTTGGDSNQGVVYSITPQGSFQVLHSFDGSDGAIPSSVLWLPDGNIYGTTESGGDFDEGTVFRLAPSGTLTTLHSFTREEGFVANGLVPDLTGTLWGATQYGGDAQQGTIYRIARDGSNFTLVFTFDGGANGGDVSQALVAGCDGAMYGTTIYGGTYNQGTLFRVNHAGQFSTLHSFGAGAEGSYPGGGSPIVLGPVCRFYGLTSVGGTLGGGTLYEADTLGNIGALANFDPTVEQTALQIAWPNQIIVNEGTGGPAQAGAILRGDLPLVW